MRNLFLVLVLANLAFAAWHAWFAEPAAPARPPPQAAPGITLVSELPTEAAQQVTAPPSGALIPPGAPPADAVASTEPAAETSAARSDPLGASSQRGDGAADPPGAADPAGGADPAAGSPLVAQRCVTVGPFRELAQAASAAATLRMSGYEPLQRVAEGDVWIGYWVYIQAIPTVAEANDIVERIKAQGITDAYVIPNTDTGNLISLGVFTEISGVTRRRDEMRALGFEPAVVDRTRRATVYWVDVQLAPEETLDLDALQTPGRILRLEQRRCEAAGG